jgi:putative acetyltransferase
MVRHLSWGLAVSNFIVYRENDRQQFPEEISNSQFPTLLFMYRPDDDGTIVRPFRVEDYDAVVALWRRTEGVGLNESDTRRAIAAYLRHNPRLSFVAEKDGRIIGAVLCGHDGRRGYLHHLAVSKRHRKCGIGRRLVGVCLAKLRKAGIQKCNIFIFANNAAGMKFWTHTGWNLRTELRLMQIRLDDGRGAREDCTC